MNRHNLITLIGIVIIVVVILAIELCFCLTLAPPVKPGGLVPDVINYEMQWRFTND